MEWTDSALNDYLLGSSSPEAAERIEARLLDDEDLFAALQSAEDDLFDSYARGRLDAATRARFLERYGHEMDRRRFAGALAHRTASPARATHSPRAQQRWMPLAAAAVLVVAAGALYTRIEAPAPLVMKAPPQATAPVSRSPFVVTLALGTSRAAGDATLVTIPKDTAIVEVRVRLDPADRFDTYSVDVRGAGDLVVWRGTGLTAETIDGILTVTARIPAPSLSSGGPHEVAVRGAGTDLGFVPMTIRWSP